MRSIRCGYLTWTEGYCEFESHYSDNTDEGYAIKAKEDNLATRSQI